MEIPLLTIGESNVYQTLVKLGESSIGNIIKNSGVSHSKIYDILKRLSKKGLISSVNKNGRQYFSASDPSRLIELVNDKQKSLETDKNKIKEAITKLEGSKETISPISVLSSFEGIKGMKTVLESILMRIKKDEEILILGSPKDIENKIGGYIKDWQKRRIEKGAKCKIIVDSDSESWKEAWWEKSKKKKLTFTKRLKSDSPAYFVITPNSVTTIYFSDVILSFIVDHEEIAERYKQFFDQLWRR
jgi:HTH-type transcriptional regulator, sugar sensing transcriptional regulator